MNVNLVECTDFRQANDVHIREHARLGSKTDNTRHYLAQDSSSEVAFVSVDLRDDLKALVLYDIYVPPKMRRRGIGTRVLGEVEKLAVRLGLVRVIVYPKPFEGNYPKERLIDWYRRNGYEEKSDNPRELEKRLPSL